MESFLEKIGLIDHLTTKLKVKKQDFASALYYSVDIGSTSLLAGAFDAFSSSAHSYRGIVTPDSFSIRRKKRFFDMNGSYAKAEGHFYQEGDLLIIDSKITGFYQAYLPFFIIALIFYAVFIGVFLFTGDHSSYFILPFLAFHACLMLGIPLFIMVKSVKRLKHELERDFYFLTKPFPENNRK